MRAGVGASLFFPSPPDTEEITGIVVGKGWGLDGTEGRLLEVGTGWVAEGGASSGWVVERGAPSEGSGLDGQLTS